MRNEIEKVLDEVWGSMRYDSEEATDKILALIEGIVPPEQEIEYIKDGKPGWDDPNEYECGWNDCREVILDNLKEKGEV